jgi:hypothetical protein
MQYIPSARANGGEAMKPGSQYHYLLHNVRKLKAGEAYIATMGEDFTCQPDSFRGVVYELALTKGGGWKGTATVLGTSVVYAFYKDSDYMRPNLSAYPLVKKLKG